MRVYANLIHQNLALFDLPKAKYDQANSYVEKIFKQLLVYDQLPDDDLHAVLNQALESELSKDPAFQSAFSESFEQYIIRGRHHAKWEKIRKDYNAYIDWETKRRNKENPYYAAEFTDLKQWDLIPNFSRERKNQPYQFDVLYRQSQILAGSVYEINKEFEQLHDKDLFKAKVNSLLVPSKIIFALSSNDSSDFSESQIRVVDIKLSMDAYKLGYGYLNQLIDALHKISWNQPSLEVIPKAIKSAELLLQRLKSRIIESERNFMLYLDADFEPEE